MLKNYFTIAWRNLLKNKLYSLVNITGLATGMAVAMIIGLLISCAIASPIAWYSMNEWLKSYQFKTSIGVGIFIMVALMAMLITLATVSFQAAKAAMANPVRSLRAE
jgi:high-affinity Fe2+/Pb2+ permease